MQLFVGMLLITNSFILTAQTSEVIQLILDLTALFFVQELDDMAFHTLGNLQRGWWMIARRYRI
jgi:hypothetical protein